MSNVVARLWVALAERYRFERELGAGGMASVYLARDVRHDRSVALKVLRPDLAAVVGADRFLAEIKVTANLHHPHILPLHDSGEADGFLFYVMPYVEGESLRDRLNREKQLPIADAVRIATEVAAALDYAHRRGVIHRDIKPENILLHDGQALVADFGISLAVSSASGTRLTETGMSVGTPHYMSPEQAMGEREVTPRSDVYSLGATLYEMLAGEPPFTGPTAQSIVAKMLTEDPKPLLPLRRTIPPALEAAVLTALAKLPADRFSGAAEFATALRDPSFTMPSTGRRPLSRPRPRGQFVPWMLLGILAVVFAFVELRPKTAPNPPPIYRFNIMLPENASWVGDVSSTPALSPDGTLLVYNGRDSTGQRRLYSRSMSRLEPTPIPGSENGSSPFFSPDGGWIGFTLGTRLVKASVTGGPPATACEVGSLPRATWLESGVIVFSDSSGLELCASTGKVSRLAASDPTERFYQPRGLPNDRGVLFTIQKGSTNRLAVFDLAARTVKRLDIVGSDPRWVTSGHLVYLGADGVLRAVPFDTHRLTETGEPVVIDARVTTDLAAAVMALSTNGTMVYPGAAQYALELVDRTGRAERLSTQLGDFGDPRVSPDGGQIAVRVGDGIWVFNRSQRTLTRLSSDSGTQRPAWSADGRRVGYVRQVGAKVDLRVVNADFSTAPESLLSLPSLELWEVSFHAGDGSMVVRTVGGVGRRDIWLVPNVAGGRLVSLLTTSANEVSPAVSPNGRWLAYVSDESGRTEVYVRPFPSGGARTQVSVGGGTEPVWSHRGDELFYRSGPAVLVAVVKSNPAGAFEVTRRALLFSDGSYAADLTHQVYDVLPDGSRLVMVRRLESANYFTVTLNLFEHLGQAAAKGSSSEGAVQRR